MKYIGLILIALGLAFLTFSFISFINSQNQFHSPIPLDKGIKVIIITPEKGK
ncbi:MAG TPA: hypothetical protein VJB63_01240 [Patescibacteria group bacterium]|nr:hypothetical protein [Patescibacteria group bacterium]